MLPHRINRRVCVCCRRQHLESTNFFSIDCDPDGEHRLGELSNPTHFRGPKMRQLAGNSTLARAHDQLEMKSEHRSARDDPSFSETRRDMLQLVSLLLPFSARRDRNPNNEANERFH